ncbi:SMP-30/gluconolactonase/LRE family protein [Flavihumibacter petaseus]|uniref:Putative hydrolase n=1 Tax=Flavihumibacter petaseus NBRC 106054 TaxID=1220578 RepID=A0A0E9MVH2_9BACT|nr:SMP-30/gluconolactonase/LRE family protein [Flavihumibacter petaseus]GAO41579.1 putative hydrolase [Flavihumibacter petaseus NBRC 106054]
MIAADKLTPSLQPVFCHGKFSESPLWLPCGHWLFSDVEEGNLWELRNGQCRRSDFTKRLVPPTPHPLHSSHTGPNGLATTPQGNLLVCHHGHHALLIIDDFGCRKLVSYYNGRPFNSPNDIAVKADGRIYFTDPPYGLKDQRLHPGYFQSTAGTYLFYKEECIKIDDTLQYPNGICFSPDEQLLYISSNHPDEKMILVFRVQANGHLSPPRQFAAFNSDGMTTDRDGNLYLTGSDAVIKLDYRGNFKGSSPFPGMTTNIAFGGHSGKELLVTAGENVFLFEEGLKFN